MALPITPVPADDLVMSIAFALLVVAVICLVGFVIWLGRRLMLQMLATRQVAESQRLARREQQFKGEIERVKSQRWHVAPSGGSGPVAIHRTPLPKQTKAELPPEPPPLPQPKSAPDWSDSRIMTMEVSEQDLVEGEAAAEAEPLPTDSGEHPLGNVTEPFELVPERAATVVWPHRKLPPVRGD